MQGSTNFIQSQNHILDRKFDLGEKNLLFCKHKLRNNSCTFFSPYFQSPYRLQNLKEKHSKHSTVCPP